MPTALMDLPALAEPPRKKWTRKECEELPSVVLRGERLELIEGDLISKMGKLRPHVIGLNRMRVWLDRTFGPFFVNSEAPIDVAPEDNPSNEPEPGLIVLRREQSYFKENPHPGDLHLLVEVADTSLSLDLRIKARLYARAGIVEYWVLDIKNRRLIVHREPGGGQYASIAVYAESELVAPLAAPASQLRVGDVLPD